MDQAALFAQDCLRLSSTINNQWTYFVMAKAKPTEFSLLTDTSAVKCLSESADSCKGQLGLLSQVAFEVGARLIAKGDADGMFASLKVSQLLRETDEHPSGILVVLLFGSQAPVLPR